MTPPRLALFSALLALCLGLTFPASASAQDYQDYKDYSHTRIVRLSLVEGDVQVLRPEAEEWEQALLNLPIQQGYTLASGRGRGEIELESGATVRIAEDTVLEFTELALADGARITRLALKQGTATFYANLARHDVFTVTTPYLSVAIPDNARFRLDALQSGTTVSVLKGDVHVEAADSTYKLTKGRSLIFQESAAAQVTLARSAEPDAWDRWVADRDEVISTARNDTLRYVNAPFRYGLADLSSYGLWYHDARFGYVWQPWGLYSGWSPYFQGRWVFINGYGWTWVSYEPWGWVPYHYGRWVLTGRGWVWVPGFQYGWHPGLVAWVNFGDHVGWCPLGPRDHIGATFRNPQGGVVITNTPGGVIGGTPNGTTNVSPTNPPQFVARAPLPDHGRRGRSFETDAGGPMVRPRGVTPGASAPATGGAVAGANGLQPAGTATPLSPSRGETGIVYDRDEHRFVNNPRGPARPRVEDAPTGRTPSSTGPARPQGAPSEPGNTPSEPPRSSTTPARPSWGSRPEEPRTPPRAEPPARPAYTPPPRTETPRPTYTPPPRTETPRPTYSPPPRAEAPRPSPPPSQPRSEAAPRPSNPPPHQQPPRGESKPQKP